MKNYVNLHPGDDMREELRAFQGCPTIARTRGGRLFAGWYTGGLLEPCIDNVNVLVKSDDNGETWSKPIVTIATDRENRNRNIDIQLWVDEIGRLWVMWTRSPYPEGAPAATIRTPFNCNYHDAFTGVEAMICRDPDADELLWEEPRVISYGFLRCKPIITREGRYIFPAYDWLHEKNYMLRYSDDRGETFYDVTAAEKPDNRVFDETMVYESGDKLVLLARTIRGYYATSTSSDGGRTWSETTSYMPAPSTRMYIARLKSGRLAFVRNISDTERTGMKICLSEDEGRTWPWQLVLDTRTDVSYPDLTEDDEGNLYIVHDRERDNRYHLDRENWTSTAAKEILLSRVTEKDIMAGTPGEGSYAAKVISKGLYNKVDK